MPSSRLKPMLDIAMWEHVVRQRLVEDAPAVSITDEVVQFARKELQKKNTVYYVRIFTQGSIV
jgi:hypothetical protein